MRSTNSVVWSSLHLFKSFNFHQAFVRLTLGKQEIFYVAQADSKSRYKFELDVSGTASDFGNQSGEYTLVRTGWSLLIVRVNILRHTQRYLHNGAQSPLFTFALFTLPLFLLPLFSSLLSHFVCHPPPPPLHLCADTDYWRLRSGESILMGRSEFGMSMAR